MKNISKMNNSPKTPGGISKSLLTPCRRVGLSRNWKKAGPAPFVSPITSSSENSVRAEAVIEKKISNTKLRAKKIDVDKSEEISYSPRNKDVDKSEETSYSPRSNDEEPVSSSKNTVLINTPIRTVNLSQRSRSKTLISPCKEDKQNDHAIIQEGEVLTKNEQGQIDTVNKTDELVSKPVRSKSITINKVSPQKKAVSKVDENASVIIESKFNNVNPSKTFSYSVKEKSPNNLSKECIVVIQRKINKNAIKKPDIKENVDVDNKKLNPVSQALFDSDSDEAPLSTMTKKISEEDLQIDSKKRLREALDDDDNFSDSKIIPKKLKKLENNATCISDVKPKPSKSTAINKNKSNAPVTLLKNLEKQSSQGSNSFDDDDDDFDFDRKKTILVRKTYDKVVKPQKAKSTGSVTQKDIDDLKARIEMKKNMLLAKAMTNDTADLRFLIKKWKKGCQDALIELMDLMKTKLPDRQHMDYSDILKMLNIPSSLVGYDSDNDSFTSPTDASIILAKFA